MDLPIILAAAVISTTIQTAPVVSIDPVVRNEVVTTHLQSCNQVTVNNNNSMVGAVVGGLIGSQIGRNDNTRLVMTGLGTIVGAQVFNNPSYETHCTPTFAQQVVPTVIGYNVGYIVNGVRHSTFMTYNPGTHVTVYPTHTVR